MRRVKLFLEFICMLFKHLYIESVNCIRIYLYQCRHSKTPEVMLSKLRVLTHALDKGLCVAARQGVRGQDKYLMCRDIIKKLEGTSFADDPTLEWSRDKLCDYERMSKEAGCLKGELFKSPDADERQKIISFIMARRSVRNFNNDKIGQSILLEIINVARWAPNSCCRQSVYFYVSQNHEQISQCMSLTPGATCFSESVPCFICVCGDMRLYPLSDKGLLYIDGALAVENMLLAAHAYGIEGTVLNWRQHMRVQERKMKEVLDIAPYHSIVVNVALGYPASIPPTPSRKALDSVWKMTGADDL